MWYLHLLEIDIWCWKHFFNCLVFLPNQLAQPVHLDSSATNHNSSCTYHFDCFPNIFERKGDCSSLWNRHYLYAVCLCWDSLYAVALFSPSCCWTSLLDKCIFILFEQWARFATYFGICLDDRCNTNKDWSAPMYFEIPVVSASMSLHYNSFSIKILPDQLPRMDRGATSNSCVVHSGGRASVWASNCSGVIHAHPPTQQLELCITETGLCNFWTTKVLLTW